MIKIKGSVVSSQQFDFNGKKYVSIQGFLEKIGIFKTSVPEEKIPDELEGKKIEVTYDVGVDSRFKPTLKLVGIRVDNA